VKIDPIMMKFGTPNQIVTRITWSSISSFSP